MNKTVKHNDDLSKVETWENYDFDAKNFLVVCSIQILATTIHVLK